VRGVKRLRTAAGTVAATPGVEGTPAARTLYVGLGAIGKS